MEMLAADGDAVAAEDDEEEANNEEGRLGAWLVKMVAEAASDREAVGTASEEEDMERETPEARPNGPPDEALAAGGGEEVDTAADVKEATDVDVNS